MAVALHADAYFRAEEERAPQRVRVVEAANYGGGHEARAGQHGGPDNQVLVNILEKLSELTARLEQAAQRAPRAQSNGRQCFVCGSYSHLQRACPRNRSRDDRRQAAGPSGPGRGDSEAENDQRLTQQVGGQSN